MTLGRVGYSVGRFKGFFFFGGGGGRGKGHEVYLIHNYLEINHNYEN